MRTRREIADNMISVSETLIKLANDSHYTAAERTLAALVSLVNIQILQLETSLDIRELLSEQDKPNSAME